MFKAKASNKTEKNNALVLNTMQCEFGTERSESSKLGKQDSEAGLRQTLTIFDNKQRLSVSYKYDIMGREIEKQNGNGITQYTTYDKAGRVVLIIEKSVTGELLRGEGYLYDTVGRRSATITDTGAITRYEYNSEGQLSVVYYSDTPELKALHEKEAEQNGVFYQERNASAVNVFLTGEEYNALQLLLNNMHYTLGNRLSVVQTFRTEVYTYDANGNRKTKTTPCGTIDYSYDRENRLISSGWNGQVAVTYTYDANGNLLEENGRLTVSTYKYNGQNRMVYSRVIDKLQKNAVTTRYEYDAFGRRVIVQEEGSDTMKTLYDGFTFEIVKESPIFANGLFTDKYNTGIQYSTSNTGKPTGDRYRYIEDETDDSRYRYIEDSVYELQTPRFTGNRAVLYGNGSPVAVNRGSSSSSSSSNSNSASSSSTSSGGFYSPTETRYTNTSYLQDNISYLGTDILGSVRTVTSSYGTVESESTYDVFGIPITGTYTTDVDFAYLGKPYDTATGLYNYGYRDYSPSAARFTTVDPIKDGANWFVYVNNDPINYVDLWGLSATDGNLAEVRNGIATPVGNTFENLKVSSEWGKRESLKTEKGSTKDGHNGMDFAAKKGTRTNAVMDGIVTYVDSEGKGGYGKVVIVTHASGTQTLYAHHDTVIVKVNDRVVAGQQLGTVGSTGKSTGAHLHISYDGNKDGTFSRTDKSDDPSVILYSGAPE